MYTVFQNSFMHSQFWMRVLFFGFVRMFVYAVGWHANSAEEYPLQKLRDKVEGRLMFDGSSADLAWSTYKGCYIYSNETHYTSRQPCRRALSWFGVVSLEWIPYISLKILEKVGATTQLVCCTNPKFFCFLSDDSACSKRWECSVCLKSYMQKRTLIKHQKFECNVVPKFFCSFCHRVFLSVETWGVISPSFIGNCGNLNFSLNLRHLKPVVVAFQTLGDWMDLVFNG